MEGMLQEIAQACANATGADVPHLVLEPRQIMKVTCYAFKETENDRQKLP
jgi:hypothetical protein